MAHLRCLEHFQKCYSRSAAIQMRAVFLGFGFVSAQSQGCYEPAPSPKPRQNPKILAPNGYSIFSNALTAARLARLPFHGFANPGSSQRFSIFHLRGKTYGNVLVGSSS